MAEENREIRIGVIGLGFGGRTQIPAFSAVPGVKIAAVCSLSPGRLGEISERIGAQPYRNYLDLLEQEELDLVCVSTPPAMHKQMATDVLKRKIHLLLEKPLGLHLAEAREILDAARQAECLAAVGYEFRYAPSRKIIQELLLDDRLGEIRFIIATEFSPLLCNPRTQYPTWVTDAQSGGGIHGSHTIDLLIHFFGDVEWVSAHEKVFVKTRYRNDQPFEATASDAMTCSIGFHSGAVGILAVSPAVAHGGRRLEIRGDKGTLILTDEAHLFYGAVGKPIEEIWFDPQIAASKARIVGDYSLIDRCYQALARDVISATRGENLTLPDIEAAWKVEQVLESIRLSARSKKMIHVANIRE